MSLTFCTTIKTLIAYSVTDFTHFSQYIHTFHNVDNLHIVQILHIFKAVKLSQVVQPYLLPQSPATDGPTSFHLTLSSWTHRLHSETTKLSLSLTACTPKQEICYGCVQRFPLKIVWTNSCFLNRLILAIFSFRKTFYYGSSFSQIFGAPVIS